MTVDDLIEALRKLSSGNWDRKVTFVCADDYEPKHIEITSCKLVMLKKDEFSIGDSNDNDDPIYIKGQVIVELR